MIGRVLLAERPHNLHDDIADHMVKSVGHIKESERAFQDFLPSNAAANPGFAD